MKVSSMWLGPAALGALLASLVVGYASAAGAEWATDGLAVLLQETEEPSQLPAEPTMPEDEKGGAGSGSTLVTGVLVGLGLGAVTAAIIGLVVAIRRSGRAGRTASKNESARPGESVPPGPPDEPDQAVAVISGTTQVHAGDLVSLHARDSRAAEERQIVSYDWDFGDGTQARGVEVSHLYVRAGVYTVSLTIADAAGWSHSTAAQIRVTVPPEPLQPAQPPEAVILSPDEAQVGEAVTFDASYSTASGSISSHKWNFGDGTAADAVSIDHVYSSSGAYHVTLIVVDSTGRRGSATRPIRVRAVPPREPTDADKGGQVAM